MKKDNNVTTTEEQLKGDASLKINEMMKKLQERVKEFSIQLPFMGNREKGELDRLYGSPVTIRDYGFLPDTKKNMDYVCFIVDEDPQNFYFGGMVLTEQLKALDGEGFKDVIVECGLPTLLGSKKGKNKREYTTVEFYPEK